MGVYLSQLPPAELARLKAELAETLIAYFCYPRFFDYRTESLRTRPVDRAKRQEVWLYLSSVDFTSWNRIDLMSSDFQYQIERLFIHFVQRNRSFFGEQGRKRMADIRMLIGTSASSVVQRLRGYLSGKTIGNLPFGSPRPVISWSVTSAPRPVEKSWEQMAPAAMLLQQQLQELRGEIKPATPQMVTTESLNEARITVAPARHTSRPQPVASQTTKGIEHQATLVSHVPVPKTPLQANGRSVSSTPTLPGHQTPPPSNPSRSSTTVPPTPTLKAEPVVSSVEASAAPLTQAASVAPSTVTGKPSNRIAPTASVPEKAQPPVPASPAVQQRVPAQTVTVVAPSARESASVMASEEDMAIFEQLRHQVIVWLRIEAVRSGIDIANQAPLQLLELLRQHEVCDESRLQIISTLLNLSNQVLKNGQASLFDYKQALMFHLMHTRR